MRSKINGVAVLIAAIAHFALQAVWFTVFNQQWIAGAGMTPEQVSQAQAHPSPAPYFVAFVCNLIFAYAIAWVLVRMERPNLIRGIFVGAVLGLVAAVAIVTELSFEQRTPLFKLIAGGYTIVGGIIMGAIIGAWKKKAAPDAEPRATSASMTQK